MLDVDRGDRASVLLRAQVDAQVGQRRLVANLLFELSYSCCIIGVGGSIMTKPGLKEKAIQLRVTKRESVKSISRALGVAVSTVSLWVRKYPLTTEERRNRWQSAYKKGGEAVRAMFKKLRSEIADDAGREFAKLSKDSGFMFGLGLYLGEGAKSQSISMSNLDLGVLRIFVSWCSEFLGARKFSGCIFSDDAVNYRKFCREVERAIGARVAWCSWPIRDSRINKTKDWKRKYGTVMVRVVGVPRASARVETWLKLSKASIV